MLPLPHLLRAFTKQWMNGIKNGMWETQGAYTQMV